jgi:GTP-binding protein
LQTPGFGLPTSEAWSLKSGVYVVLQARFVLSAASATDFPTTGLPEIAMVGRSNVGKSTLINALVKQKVARTSAAPGKTRLANYYLIDPGPRTSDSSLYLVDLPGYGYARGGEASAEEFGQLTRQYFERADNSRRRLAGVLHLIDARHPALPADAAAHDWLTRVGVPICVVATKFDKLNQSEKTRVLNLLSRQYDCQILPGSAPEELGLAEIWKLIRDLIESQ